MKYKLNKPNLNNIELARLNFYASYVGYIFKFNMEKLSALFEYDIDGHNDIGYIQKDDDNKLFIIWKSDESIVYIDKLIDICKQLDNHSIINETLDRYKMFVGVNSVTNYKLSDKDLQYLLRWKTT